MFGPPRHVLDDITVIVPTIGRSVLEQSLASIAAGSRWPARLVLVHQGNAPHVEIWVERLRLWGLCVVHVRSDERGAAAARNRGIEHVETPLIAFTDDDQCVSPEWLARMHAWLVASPDAVVTGRVDAAGAAVPSTISSPVPAIHRSPLLDRDPLFSGNMGARVDVVTRVGPFDEAAALNGAEDNDWGYRALRAGVPILYAPDIVVTHLDWRDRTDLAITYRRYALAQGGFYGKHLRRRDLFIARRAARDLVRGPWLILRAAATRNADLAMIGQAETRGILPGILAGLRTSSS
jgi:GT2 family glycosyltransferase